jgi:hypothetical protein
MVAAPTTIPPVQSRPKKVRRDTSFFILNRDFPFDRLFIGERIVAGLYYLPPTTPIGKSFQAKMLEPEA